MKHGDSSHEDMHPIYLRWQGIRHRCRNKPTYRNIPICKEWEDYLEFKSWALEHGFKPELQIDRIDNSKGYSPDNCRFVTHRENQNNKRRHVRYNFFGEELTCSEAAKLYGVDRTTIVWRIKKRGLSPNDAVTYARYGRASPNN